MEYTFTSDNFEEEVLKSDVPVLVDMFATWCGPCKMMAPVVAQLAEEYEGTVKVGKLDIDQNVDIVAQYKIMSVPTFLVIKDGEVVKKLIGAVSKEELVEAIGQAK
ncbi:MAG: thioredoxin [Anaerostipes hadrus]|jgi:thioredoxin 1